MKIHFKKERMQCSNFHPSKLSINPKIPGPRNSNYPGHLTVYFRDVSSRTQILDDYLDKCGAVLMEQTEITSEAMRVMGAKNWVGFIARARDEMTPKILDFCNRRDEFTNIKLPGTCF